MLQVFCISGQENFFRVPAYCSNSKKESGCNNNYVQSYHACLFVKFYEGAHIPRMSCWRANGSRELETVVNCPGSVLCTKFRNLENTCSLPKKIPSTLVWKQNEEFKTPNFNERILGELNFGSIPVQKLGWRTAIHKLSHRVCDCRPSSVLDSSHGLYNSTKETGMQVLRSRLWILNSHFQSEDAVLD